MVAIFCFALFYHYLLDFEVFNPAHVVSVCYCCAKFFIICCFFWSVYLSLLAFKSIDMFFIRVECIVNYLGWAGLYYFYI
jgi:hypothetical protein